jgi:hypothetical protein
MAQIGRQVKLSTAADNVNCLLLTTELALDFQTRDP